MNVPKILIIIALLFILVHFIGWLTKPDNYKPPQNYRGSLSPIQPYAQHYNKQGSLVLATENILSLEI
jgi:hypothetical protein